MMMKFKCVAVDRSTKTRTQVHKVQTKEQPVYEGKFRDLMPRMFEHLFLNFDLTQDEVKTLTESILVLDSTKLETYIGCPRKFLFSSIIGLTPGFISLDTVFGVAMHEGLGVLYESGKPMAQVFASAQEAFANSFSPYVGVVKESKSKTLERGKEALLLYAMTYGESDKALHKVGTAEAAYIMDVNGVPFVVKPDLVVRDTVANPNEGNIHVVEHKTTGLLSRTWFQVTYPSLQPGAYTKYLLTSGICDQAEIGYPLLNLIVFPTTKNLSAKDMFYREYFGAEYGSPSDYADSWTIRVTRHLNHLYQDLRSLLNVDLEDTHTCVDAFPMHSNCYKFGQVCHYNGICHQYAKNPLRVCCKSEAEVAEKLFSLHVWNPLHQFEQNLELFRKAIAKQQKAFKDDMVMDYANAVAHLTFE
jgi:hypothetical protein